MVQKFIFKKISKIFKIFKEKNTKYYVKNGRFEKLIIFIAIFLI